MAARKVHQGLGRRLTVGLGGEVNLGGVIDQFLPHSLPDDASEEVAARLRLLHPLLQRGMRVSEVWGNCIGVLQANMTLVSLTSPFTSHTSRSRGATGAPKADACRSHPLNIEVLMDANVDVVALANGHSMDFNEEGLAETLEVLDSVSVAHAGAGPDRRCALRPALVRAMGRKVAVFSVSLAGSGLRDAASRDMWAADERRSGIAHFDVSDEGVGVDDALAELKMAVERAREVQRIHLVIFSVCWLDGRREGRAESSSTASAPLSAMQPSSGQRLFAHGLVDVAGAQLVHGHGLSHMQGVELWHGVPILYSCGSLIGGDEKLLRTRVSRALRPELSCFFTLHISALNQLEWLEMKPLCSRLFQLNLASGRNKQWVLATMQRLCAELGTPVQLMHGKLSIPLMPRAPPLERPAAGGGGSKRGQQVASAQVRFRGSCQGGSSMQGVSATHSFMEELGKERGQRVDDLTSRYAWATAWQQQLEEVLGSVWHRVAGTRQSGTAIGGDKRLLSTSQRSAYAIGHPMHVIANRSAPEQQHPIGMQ